MSELHDCHRCRSYDLPYWCCPYCHRTLAVADPEERARRRWIDALVRSAERRRHDPDDATTGRWARRSFAELERGFDPLGDS